MGDVDADGREELILVSHVPQGPAPDAVKLTIWGVNDRGGLARRRVLDLGNEPLVWDVWGGLWAYDADGLLAIDPDTGARTRLAELPTPLGGLGPSTPIKGRLAHDLLGQGGAQLVVHSRGRYHAYRTDGASLGSVKAPARGELRQEGALGGSRLRASAEPPALVIGDVDGDGLQDLVLPQGRALAVHFTGPDGVGARRARLALPVDLDPREDLEPRKDEERRRITRIWLGDLDGDGRLDLGLHRMVVSGSWFGTTAELLFAAGTGQGFGSPQIVVLDDASFFGFTLDADGDGDTDLLIPQMDTGLTSLGKALVTKALPVDLDLYRFGSGGYELEPTTLLEVAQQVEGGDSPAWVYDDRSDVDGDGLPDLVRHKGEDGLEVYLARDAFSGGRATYNVDVPLPEGGQLMVHDLTGDGRAEVLVWAPRGISGTLLTAQPD